MQAVGVLPGQARCACTKATLHFENELGHTSDANFRTLTLQKYACCLHAPN